MTTIYYLLMVLGILMASREFFLIHGEASKQPDWVFTFQHRLENILDKMGANIEKKVQTIETKVKKILDSVTEKIEDLGTGMVLLKSNLELLKLLGKSSKRNLISMKTTLRSIKGKTKDIDLRQKLLKSYAKPAPSICKKGVEAHDFYKVTANLFRAVRPDNTTESDPILCDIHTEGGGWVVFQRRTDNLSFDHLWEGYKHGFGQFERSFWLGLEKLHLLTAWGHHTLQIEGSNEEFSVRKHYSQFKVYPESSKYKLKVRIPSPNDKMAMVWHVGNVFSTADNINDHYYRRNCVKNVHAGGWWFSTRQRDVCARINFNSLDWNHNQSHDSPLGPTWWDDKGLYWVCTFTQMMVRED